MPSRPSSGGQRIAQPRRGRTQFRQQTAIVDDLEVRADQRHQCEQRIDGFGTQFQYAVVRIASLEDAAPRRDARRSGSREPCLTATNRTPARRHPRRGLEPESRRQQRRCGLDSPGQSRGDGGGCQLPDCARVGDVPFATCKGRKTTTDAQMGVWALSRAFFDSLRDTTDPHITLGAGTPAPARVIGCTRHRIPPGHFMPCRKRTFAWRP